MRREKGKVILKYTMVGGSFLEVLVSSTRETAKILAHSREATFSRLFFPSNISDLV